MPLVNLQILYSKVHCPVCCIVDWVNAASHSIRVMLWLLQTSLSQKHCPDAVRDFPHGCGGSGAGAGERGVAVGCPRLQEVTCPWYLFGKIVWQLQP